MVGLDNSGKSSVVNSLKPEKDEDVTPTIGWSVERFKVGNMKLTVMDMSGQSKYRQLWEAYYADVNAIVFVVDAADKRRFNEAHTSLHEIIAHKQLAKMPLLLYCNKMDLGEALRPSDLAIELQLNSINDRTWHIQPSCALTAEGIQDGLRWLLARVKKG